MNTLFALNHWIERSASAFARAMRKTAESAMSTGSRGERPTHKPSEFSTNTSKAYQRPLLAKVARPNPRQLRVVHVLEHGMPHGSSGRLFISGGIDEVCAELDRLILRQEAILDRLPPAAQSRLDLRRDS